MNNDIKNLAIEVIRSLPQANLKELLAEAMKRNRGSMNPGYMQEAIILELTLDKHGLLAAISELSKGDARMDTKLDEFLTILENRVKEIDAKLNGN